MAKQSDDPWRWKSQTDGPSPLETGLHCNHCNFSEFQRKAIINRGSWQAVFGLTETHSRKYILFGMSIVLAVTRKHEFSKVTWCCDDAAYVNRQRK